jgi:hypothetical protein
MSSGRKRATRKTLAGRRHRMIAHSHDIWQGHGIADHRIGENPWHIEYSTSVSFPTTAKKDRPTNGSWATITIRVDERLRLMAAGQRAKEFSNSGESCG